MKMCINPVPQNIPQETLDDFWDSLIHLYKLGLIDTRIKDNKICITKKGRSYMAQIRYLENKIE